jgi:hypothetical protein
MTTPIHAWFSFETALRKGSSVYQQLARGGDGGGGGGGASVNVTRLSEEREGKGHFPADEKYVGEVVRAEDGGCLASNRRVDGISSEFLRATAAAMKAPLRSEPRVRGG